MKKDSKVIFLKNKDIDALRADIEKNGKYAILAEYSPFFDMRTYFKVDEYGNIFQKNYNPISLLYYFSDDTNKLAEYIFKYSYSIEKQNIKKIDRLSNLNVEKLKTSLIKTLVSSNLDFSKRYAKELFLRDKKSFFEVLYTFSFMGNPSSMKLFFTYVLEKIFSTIPYNENIFYIFIAYLTKYRDDYSIYINSSDDDTIFDYEEVSKTYSSDKKIYLKIFNEVLQKYKFKNSNKFKNSLFVHFQNEFLLNEDLKNELEGKL